MCVKLVTYFYNNATQIVSGHVLLRILVLLTIKNKKMILSRTAILLSFALFAQTDPNDHMMHNNSSGMYWGMGYGFWIVFIILIVIILIFLWNRRRKN
jgi:ABC-type multidrug transport system permease subunit